MSIDLHIPAAAFESGQVAGYIILCTIAGIAFFAAIVGIWRNM